MNDIGIDYLSFDNDIKFAAKTDKVVIKPLVELDDKMFNDVIEGNIKFVNISQNFVAPKKIHTRQRNCFYKLDDTDIDGTFDLIILDGPNGNGRSIAFNVMKHHIKDVSFIFIDDYNHYPFIDDMCRVFNNVTLVKSHTEDNDVWEIYKIEK